MKRGVSVSFVTGFIGLVLFLLTSSAQAQPQISSLSRTTSARSGLLLIHGTNFGSQQATGHVLIDGISAIVPTWTDTEIQAYVPESAGLGTTTVMVETAGGISNAKTLDVTLRQSEGRFRWRFEMGFRSSGAWTAIAPDGTIYCSDPFRLYALTPDGALKWLIQDAGGERPISVSADGTIYTATNLAAGEVAGVIALNPDGSTRWTFIPETSGGSGVDLLAGPTLGPDGNIYATSNSSLGGPGTFSLDANGNLLWTNPSGSDGGANYEILFDTDQIYIPIWGNGGGPDIRTYDYSGDLLWTSGDLGLAPGSAPELDPFGRLILQWIDVGVQAWSPGGDVEWIYDPPGPLGLVVPPTVGSDGVIYSGTYSGGDLFAVNPDGTTKWLAENQVEGFLWHMIVSPDNSSLIDGGAPGFGAVPSSIRAFDTANGDPLWIQNFHVENGLNEFAAWIEPNFSNDGTTIYVNTEFSSNTKPANLYAVDVTLNQASEPVDPQAGKFLDGLAAFGLLPDAFESDNVYWELDPNPTTNPHKQKIDLILLSESPVASPGSIKFRLEAAMIGGPSGDVIQTLELWDETNQVWDVVDMQPATAADGVVEVSATGDLTRYVHPLTDEIIAKVKWESSSFSGTPFNWSIDVDQAVWLID